VILPVLAASWYSSTLHFQMSNEEMSARLLWMVPPIAGGLLLPWLMKPLAGALERRRQREKASRVQQQLMWVSKQRSLQRDVRIVGFRGMKLTVGHKKVPGALVFEDGTPRPELRVGHAEIDERLRMEAEAAPFLLAVLGPEARRHLTFLLHNTESLELKEGELVAMVPATRSEDDLIELGKTMIEFVEEARIEPETVPERLVERFRSDPADGVRTAALTALLTQCRAAPEAEALGAELMGGSDARLGLLAATVLGNEERIAHFEARIEGSRGRLAVSADAGDEGKLSLDVRAREGALSGVEDKG